ncbi:unnamed protein product [Caenorhabditis nigoni]
MEVSEVPVLLRDEIRFKSNSKRKLEFHLIFKSLEGAREITVPNAEGIFSEFKLFKFWIHVVKDMIHETACKAMPGGLYHVK